MIRRPLAGAVLVLAALFAGAASRAAGPKTGGVYTVEDDLLGAESFGQTGTVKRRLGLLDHHAGYFRFPFALGRMQLVLPGEAPDPDLASGKAGVPDGQVVGSTFTVLARGVDALHDQVSAAHLIRLVSSQGAVADQPLEAGATAFLNVRLLSTGTVVFTLTDLTDPSVLQATATLVVVPVSAGAPTAVLSVEGSTVATLGGGLAGRAYDGVAVSRLLVDLQNLQSGLYLGGWTGAETFSSAVPVVGTATLSAPFTSRTDWSLALPDAAFADGVSYRARLRVSNPSGFTADFYSTFTFNASGLAFAPDDGLGSAVVTPAISSGCEPVDASLVYTAGASGLKPGGALAVRVPDGWKIESVSGFNSAAISTALALAPASFSSATLGAGWMLVTVPSGPGFSAGQTLTLNVRGLPPLDARGRGTQTWEVRHQAGPGGVLKPIASAPTLALGAGTSTYLAFEEPGPIGLGPLQFSPVMRLLAVDLCGFAKSTTTALSVPLSAGASGASGFTDDPGAQFFSAATGLPVTQAVFAPGLSYSTSFYYFTTNPSGLSYEVVLASHPALPVDGGGTAPAQAARGAVLAASALSLTSVSVDTGTLSPSATSAAVVPGGGPAYLRLRASAVGVPWEVVLSTDSVTFWPPVLRASGLTTEEGETVAWAGVDQLASPPRAAAAGAYRARVRLGGGTVSDETRELRVARSAFITGRLAASGGFALVSAKGPSLGAARSTLASSTGYFELRGLSPGQAYALTLTTVTASVGGRAVTLSTAIVGVVASEAGTSAGTAIALPAASYLRAAAQLSRPAPREVFGAATARSASGELAASGVLRFSSGSASSDDGAAAFGAAASTWTVVPLPAGTYDVELSVPELGLSTRASVAVPSGGSADFGAVLGRKAWLFGSVSAATAPASGAPVALEASRPWSASPERFASALVAAGGSTSSFVLFGLDPGSWTVTARSPGLLAASANVLVVEDFDLGVASAPALSLSLPTGGVVTGTVTVSGSTGTFVIAVEAFNPATLDARSTSARVVSAQSPSTAAFFLGGLSSGSWILRATAPGLLMSPSTGFAIAVATPAAATAALSLTAQSGLLSLTLVLPPKAGGGCRTPAEFSGASVECAGASLAGSTVTYGCSSLTALLPALLPGEREARAYFSDTGASAAATYSVVAGTTAFGALDLSRSTFAVSGLVSVSGSIRLSGPGFSVDASSVPALVGRAPGLRVELTAVGASSPTAVSSVSADGSFGFMTSAGSWRVSVPGDLDGDAANGVEAAQTGVVLVVTRTVSGLRLTLERGASVSGRLALPAGASGGGTALVTMTGDEGSLSARALFAPGSSQASFVVRGAGRGRWLLAVEDAGSPRRFAPRSRFLELTGGDLDAGTIDLSASGALVGRLAEERALADGTTSVSLLGAGARVYAAASPWRPGGLFEGTVDEEGRFRVEGLGPGLYDLEVQGEGLVSASRPGLILAEGQTLDAGTVVLRAGLAVSGRAVDAATGQAAANVLVTARASLEAAGAPRALLADAQTRADASGRYVLRGLDPAVARYDVTAGEAGFEPASAKSVDPRAGTAVDFALARARHTISGRLLAPGGAAPARVLVSGLRSDFEAAAAADGSFSVDVATGAFRLTFLLEGFAPLRLGVNVSSASVSLGALSFSAAASVSGAVLGPDGGPVSAEQAASVLALRPDLSDVVPGELARDADGSVVGYSVAGLRTGLSYRLAFVSASGDLSTPPEGASIVAADSEPRLLDVVLRPARAAVAARARKTGTAYALTFDLSRPLRKRIAADDDLTSVLAAASGGGTLSARALSADRRRLTAVYAPAVGESSFTIRVGGYSADVDPDSTDSLNPELVLSATAAFQIGAEGTARGAFANVLGGVVALDGDLGRVSLPAGAFFIDGSSVVSVSLQAAPAYVAVAAAAAVPPGSAPVSAYYDVSVSSGARSSLARPAELTVAYSTAADPSRLNLYWYNPAASAWILQQDAAGGAPVLDRTARTFTLKVDHFSTFALFESGAAVIGGADFSGGEIDAFNFPNPFDLRAKTVTKLHPGAGAANETIRGTMLRFALPAAVHGKSAVRIYSVSGERLRTLDLGELSGGRYYYAEWDGRNDAGQDAASGVYLAEIRVGARSKFVRMALVK